MASNYPASIWPEPSAWATRHPEEFGYDTDSIAIQHWLDETRGGLWVQTFPGRFEDAALDVAFDHFDARVEAAAALGEPIGVVVDLRFARGGSPVQRRRMARTFERAREVAGGLIKAQAFVVSTPPQRGALTATLWLVSPNWPLQVFTDRLSAIAWVSMEMDAAASGE